MNRATQLYSLFQEAKMWRRYWRLIVQTLPELVEEYNFSRIFFSEPYTVFLDDDKKEKVRVFPYKGHDYFWFLHSLSDWGSISRREYHSFLQELPVKELKNILGEISRLRLDMRIYPIKITVGSFLEDILEAIVGSVSEELLLRISKNKVVTERLFIVALRTKKEEVLEFLQDKIDFTDELVWEAILSSGNEFTLLDYVPVSDTKLMDRAQYISSYAVSTVAQFLNVRGNDSPKDLFFFWYERLQENREGADAYTNLFEGFLVSGLVPLYLLIEVGLASDNWALRDWARREQEKNLENV